MSVTFQGDTIILSRGFETSRDLQGIRPSAYTLVNGGPVVTQDASFEKVEDFEDTLYAPQGWHLREYTNLLGLMAVSSIQVWHIFDLCLFPIDDCK